MVKIGFIFLHDDGGSGSDLQSYCDIVILPNNPSKSFLEIAIDRKWKLKFPTKVSVDENLRSWYSVTSGERSLDGYEQSVAEIIGCITDIASNVDDIYVCGFGSGGAVVLSLLKSLTEKSVPELNRIRGLVAISGYLTGSSSVFKSLDDYAIKMQYVKPSELLNERGLAYMNMSDLILSDTKISKPSKTAVDAKSSADSSATAGETAQGLPGIPPVLIMTGCDDLIIKSEWCERTANELVFRGVPVTLQCFEGVEHEVSPEQLAALLDWIDLLSDFKGNVLCDGDEEGNEEESLDAALMNEEKNTVNMINSKFFPKDIGKPPKFPGKPVEQKVSPVDCVPYRVEHRSDNKYTIVYYVNPLIEMDSERSLRALISNPILACGGSFEVKRHSEGVSVDVITADAYKTATEVGKRLFKRVAAGPEVVNPCPMS